MRPDPGQRKGKVVSIVRGLWRHPLGRLAALLAVGGALALWPRAAAALAPEPVSCGQVITHSTKLANDITGCPADAALVIGASHITLDLGGHAVAGHLFAIMNEGHDGVTIEHGRVSGNEQAVLLAGADGNELRDLDATSAVAGAFALRGSDRNRIEASRVGPAGQSFITLGEGSDGNLIRGNRLEGSYAQVVIIDSSHNRVLDNVVDGGLQPPLELTRSDHNTVARNRLSAVIEGSRLDGSDDNQLVDNALSSERTAGIQLTDSGRNRLAGNTAFDSAVGIGLVSGEGNLLARNSAWANRGDGVAVLSDAHATFVRGSLANGNGDDGIDVESPDTRLIANSANDNGDLGIEAVPGVFAVGNRASGNGNPLQCLNVVCR